MQELTALRPLTCRCGCLPRLSRWLPYLLYWQLARLAMRLCSAVCPTGNVPAGKGRCNSMARPSPQGALRA